jgi:hypothetical protein
MRVDHDLNAEMGVLETDIFHGETDLCAVTNVRGNAQRKGPFRPYPAVAKTNRAEEGSFSCIFYLPLALCLLARQSLQATAAMPCASKLGMAIPGESLDGLSRSFGEQWLTLRCSVTSNYFMAQAAGVEHQFFQVLINPA